MRAVGTVAVAGGALVSAAESASACSMPQVCSGASTANVCLDGYRTTVRARARRLGDDPLGFLCAHVEVRC